MGEIAGPPSGHPWGAPWMAPPDNACRHSGVTLRSISTLLGYVRFRLQDRHAHPMMTQAGGKPRPLGWTAPKAVPAPSEHCPSKNPCKLQPCGRLEDSPLTRVGQPRALGALHLQGLRRSGFTATSRRSLSNPVGSSVNGDVAAVAGLWQAGVQRPSEP